MIDPDRLRAALDAHPWVEVPALPGRTNHRRAGVLVPLQLEPEPRLLLTLRAAGLRRHGGEVSFPGGRPEPGDADLAATALREAREELGITDARVLGRLSSMPLFTSDFRMEPFVALVGPQPLTPDPGEVARVLPLTLQGALAAPDIEGIPYTLDGVEHLSPVFTLEGHVCFGATAHTLYEALGLLAAVAGRPLPPLRRSARTWAALLGPRTG
ncbi:MAG: CoA pyrophosphatase [Alphaproteobacteria bacterium]|nr:CoA pyrophosphatase [Alphaproteobacteria bacterium]